jgi:prefoldin alpha subunit
MPEKQIKFTPKQLLDTYMADEQRFSAIQKRQEELQQVITEMAKASVSLKELKKAKSEQDILVSLGAGIYTEAKTKNVKSVKASLAGSILTDTTVEKALEKLEKDMGEIQKEIRQIAEQKQKVAQNMQTISALMQQRQKAMQEKKQKEKGLSSVS